MKRPRQSKLVALLAATGLLLINFWAWSLISPLATAYQRELSISPFILSVLVAAPVLIGSLGRIPLGLLTDRLGGKKMFVVVSWATATAVVSLHAAHSTHTLLASALALGVGGASFAVGAPFVNAWFPRRQRGLALGVYALGNAGTAVSGLLTPHLSDTIGRSNTFWLVAATLFAAGIAMLAYGQDSSSWHPAKGSSWGRFAAALQWDLTWKLSVLYGLSFGAFVAFGLYLPVLLNQSYGLAPADAAARAAGFVLLATCVRPIGGWLSDRLSGLVILRLVFMVLCVLATLAAVKPALAPLGNIAYLGMAVVLGIGNGAIFAVIGHRCEERLTGTVTGIIGAAGGIGGYFPPLIMGISYQLFHNYSAALAALAVASFVITLSLRRLFGYKKSY